MPQAVGALETKGFPPALAAADAMVKAGHVTFVSLIQSCSARFTVNIRGDVSAVRMAMDAGIAAVNKTSGGLLETWIIIPRPHENVEAVMDIEYNDEVEEFRCVVEEAV
ncbi:MULTISPECIES: carbon dioxide-concentrating mechanism protein CcmK [Acaryochloris]|uniref:Carboxysome shell protein CcmK n=1 Tax=Acaryochloris marina (strain MBIC 11017) TaxID=329726 RepID=B0BYX4_ACAM1|nr:MULTISPECIES: carbon dioxide-concentrating mechanism protein CcmK [Acaryochloris]ABW28274.1 carbon dioxide concentrating mechanism protein CcmK [Acaryochloris marina MBIC11017]BDM77301.1 carbon dioxide-concentrating protein CcmK [Acaryochloris marina MBIC10699]